MKAKPEARLTGDALLGSRRLHVGRSHWQELKVLVLGSEGAGGLEPEISDAAVTIGSISHRRRRTAASAKKAQLGILLLQRRSLLAVLLLLLLQRCSLPVVLLLHRQQPGHDVRTDRIDVGRRLRAGGRLNSRSAGRSSTAVEKGFTATGVVVTVTTGVAGTATTGGLPARRILRQDRRQEVVERRVRPARAGGAGAGAGGTSRRAVTGNWRSH